MAWGLYEEHTCTESSILVIRQPIHLLGGTQFLLFASLTEAQLLGSCSPLPTSFGAIPEGRSGPHPVLCKPNAHIPFHQWLDITTFHHTMKKMSRGWGIKAGMEMNRIFQTVGRVEGDTIPAPRKDVAVHCQGQVVGETSCHLAHLQRHIFAITH